jgi:hypothetical protein
VGTTKRWERKNDMKAKLSTSDPGFMVCKELKFFGLSIPQAVWRLWWVKIVTWNNYLQPLDVLVWNCHRHSSCIFKAISCLSAVDVEREGGNTVRIKNRRFAIPCILVHGLTRINCLGQRPVHVHQK